MANSRLHTPLDTTPKHITDAVAANPKVMKLSKGMAECDRISGFMLGVALYENNEDSTDVMAARAQLLGLVNSYKRARTEFSDISTYKSCFAQPDVMRDESSRITAVLVGIESDIAVLNTRIKVLNLALEVKYQYTRIKVLNLALEVKYQCWFATRV